MKRTVLAILVMGAALGCARVRVEAPKEPIKVDVSMRLDIYQHVAKDIDDIESIVTGGSAAPAKTGNAGSSLLDPFLSLAYAQESLSAAVEAAALRRRDRNAELRSWQGQGVVGERVDGLVEIREGAQATPQLSELIMAENSDRQAIYQAIAEKNGTSVSEVQKLYAQRLQADAPAGTPLQTGDTWKSK